MKVLWPYFFFVDVSWTLSSYRSDVQVRGWRRIDENDARRGFTRRKTAEKVLQLAAFDNMNWQRRVEDMLYPGSLQNKHVVSRVSQVAASTTEIFGGIPSPGGCGFELGSCVNSLRYRHISKTHRVSCVCPGPRNVQGACIGWFFS